MLFRYVILSKLNVTIVHTMVLFFSCQNTVTPCHKELEQFQNIWRCIC